MTQRHAAPQPTAAQAHGRAELEAIAAEHPESVALIADHGLGQDSVLRMTVRLPTGDLPPGPGGLPVNATEDVTVGLGSAFPIQPPGASVDHLRFLGHAHVLQGGRLCVYLDPAREWHPRHGMAGFLEQLWQWFADAVAGRFDASTALFHPVGGVLHRSAGTPTIVLRQALPEPPKAFRRARLELRTPSRMDLRWDTQANSADALLASVFTLTAPLPLGAGTTLTSLLASVASTGSVQPQALLRQLTTTARRNVAGTPLYFVLAVPNPAAGHHHVLAGRLPAGAADRLRELSIQHGPLLEIELSSIPQNLPVEWCGLSDERPEISTRRDTGRPVTAFAGKTVHILGCGGLGSWIAEFIARAGAARIVLCDPAEAVMGGLLVRQNFTEADIGVAKAEALATRLRALSDSLQVLVAVGYVPESDDGLLPDADVVIDATVNRSLGEVLDASARENGGPLLAQVATDVQTGTLGLLVVAAADFDGGPAAIDELAGAQVQSSGDLERFALLWGSPAAGDEVIPERGCSAPTFHGSAADLAAIAGVLVSLLGAHVGTTVSGTHLVALPHAPGGPAHAFLPA